RARSCRHVSPRSRRPSSRRTAPGEPLVLPDGRVGREFRELIETCHLWQSPSRLDNRKLVAWLKVQRKTEPPGAMLDHDSRRSSSFPIFGLVTGEPATPCTIAQLPWTPLLVARSRPFSAWLRALPLLQVLHERLPCRSRRATSSYIVSVR